MPLGNPNWVPSRSGNPKGRAVGTRNRRTEAIWGKLEARDDLDPADLFSSIVHNEQEPKARILWPGPDLPVSRSRLIFFTAPAQPICRLTYYEVRAGDQPKDRESIGVDRVAHAARTRRRGDRVMVLVVAAHESAVGP
jgi:hypothetical protein